MTNACTVHLVDDDAGVVKACRYLLEGLGMVVVEWHSGEAFLAGANLAEPAAVLLDMRLPGMDGQSVHERLQAADACLGVIILTGHGDIDMAVDSMKLGAVDFLQKPVGAEALDRALNSAFARARQSASERSVRQLAASLSPRERDIARRVSDGHTNRDIAEALHIAVRTVEVHRSRVVEKMGAANSAELAALWQRIET
jgi:two-component system response regulator TtrR